MGLYEGASLPTTDITQLSEFEILSYLYHQRQCFAAVVIEKGFVEDFCNNEVEITNEEYYQHCENLNDVFIEDFEAQLFDELFCIMYQDEE